MRQTAASGNAPTLAIPGNLRPIRKADFSWDDARRLASLQILYETVSEKIEITARWYLRGKKSRRDFCRFARVAAVILATLAAAQPTLAEMNRLAIGWFYRPGVATILALLAGALLLLDRFFGASTGWVRYIIAGLGLNDLRDELEAAWRLECASWAGQEEPTVEQTKHAVILLQSFVPRANEIVRHETEAWKAEFQAALQQVDDYAKAASGRKIEQSGLKVTVTNFEKVEGEWSISLNGGRPDRVSAPQKTYVLTPGHTQIAVEATLKDTPPKHVRREEIVVVKPGEISNVQVDLK